jgi:hypothetical protein
MAARDTAPALAAVTAIRRARTRATLALWATTMAGPGHPMGCHVVTVGCRSRTPHPIGFWPQAGFGPALCEFLLKSFLFALNSRKWVKLQKFIKICRNVQKWETKFCWTPLWQLYIVGLTKLSLVQ